MNTTDPDPSQRLELRSVVGSHGARAVIRIDELDLATGVTLLAGANGSGKSTLLAGLAGLGDLQGSVVLVTGSRREPLGAGDVGFLPQHPEGLDHLAVRDACRYAQSLTPGTSSADGPDAVLHDIGIGHLARRRIAQLSGGERQLAYLAAVVVGRPAVVLLDEPTVGLDALHRHMVLAAVGAIAQHAIVVVTTHHALDVATLRNRLVVVHHGTVRFDGDPDVFAGGSPDDASLPARIEHALAAIQGS